MHKNNSSARLDRRNGCQIRNNYTITMKTLLIRRFLNLLSAERDKDNELLLIGIPKTRV
jgi:hypothetical protein